jgi:hypothetical protein
MALPRWHRHDDPMRPWAIPPSIPLLAVLVLPCAGCCSLARLFCGPDRTEWVSIDHSTPEKAVRTLLEALRRDDPQRVYDSLSSAHRQRLGLDSLTTLLAWERVREEHPYLHVAGYAEVPPARLLGPDSARVELSVEGQPVVIDLVRTLQWTVRYRRPAVDPNDSARFLPDRWGSSAERGDYVARAENLLTVEPDPTEQKSTLRIRPLVFEHPGLDEVPANTILLAGAVQEWKVDQIATP